MNKVLITLGLLAIVAAIAVQIIDFGSWGASSPELKTSQFESENKPINVGSKPAATQPLPEGESQRSVNSTHGNQSSPVEVATSLPVISMSTLSVTDRLPFDLATGRSTTSTVARQVEQDGGRDREIHPVSRQGQAEYLVRSTLGGVERQVHRIATWHLAASGEVNFLVDGTAAVLSLQGGKWVSSPIDLPPELSAALTDMARVITSVAEVFHQPQTVNPNQNLSIAGNDFLPWFFAADSLLLAGPSHDGAALTAYPPAPGAWNDLRLQIDASGRPIAAERLIASPSTAVDPGYLVRRTILRFAADNASL